MKFDIIAKTKWWFILSALVIIPGLISMVVQGFNLGIDFTGGTLLDIKFEKQVSVAEIRDVLKDFKLENSTVQLAAAAHTDTAQNVFIRTHVLTDDERRAVLVGMKDKLGAFTVQRVEHVGAVVGSELARQAILAVVISWMLMIAYITYRFEFKFAVSGILALVHDVFVVLGVFSILQVEIDATFVAALLTIIGYSINDTIVIFDRIRENLKARRKNDDLGTLVNDSIWQTMRRSLYTVFTVLFACASLYVFGGDTTKNFSLALLIGIVTGCYSSIFNASPIWVVWKKYEDRKRHIGVPKGAK